MSDEKNLFNGFTYKSSIWNFDKPTYFNHDIKKKDFLEVLSTTSSSEAMNKTGTLLFQIQQSSNPLDICNSWMYYKIRIVNTDKVNATLEHNWFFNLFDQISIKLGTNELETIENPGEISSLLNFVMTDSDYKNQYGELTG